MPRNDLEWEINFSYSDIGYGDAATMQYFAGWTGVRWEQYWYVPYQDVWGGMQPIFLAAQEAILESFGLTPDAVGLDVLGTTPPRELSALGVSPTDVDPYYTVKRVTSFVDWSKRWPLGDRTYHRGERLSTGKWTIADFDESSWRWLAAPQTLTDLDLWRTLNAMDNVPLSGRLRSFRWKSLFLAHSSIDKIFVRQLAARLSALGIRVWVDEAEIKVGDSLLARLEAAIDEMDCIGIVLTPASVTSRWVQEELKMALMRQLKTGDIVVLPLLLENTEIPGFLREKKYADFRSREGFENALDELVAGLREDFPDV